jgi:signal transduction histidine kinase
MFNETGGRADESEPGCAGNATPLRRVARRSGFRSWSYDESHRERPALQSIRSAPRGQAQIGRDFASHDAGPADEVMSMNQIHQGLDEAVQPPRRARTIHAQELLRRRLQLARTERLLTAGELAAAFAHVLNQPLTAIIGYSDAGLLLERAGPVSQDKAQRYFDEIRKQAHRAARGILELRGFLNREAAPEAVDLNAVVRELHTLLRAELPPAGIRIELDLAAGLGLVRANRVHVEQVLLALIGNAVDALGDADAAAGCILVRSVERDGMAQVSVCDSGPGLDAAVLAGFGESLRTTKRNGLGLGLMLARSLIESHRGRLWAESAPGSGAQIHLTLPLANRS